MKKWSSQWTQFMQLRKVAWKKFGTSTGFEPVTSRLPVRCSTNWAMKPVHVWFISYIINTHFFHGNIWTHNWPAHNVSGFIAQLVEHRTTNREVTSSNPVEVLNFFQASLRSCKNCVHCDDHFFIFISFPQFIYDLFHISLTLISFTGTYEPTIDLLPTSVASYLSW